MITEFKSYTSVDISTSGTVVYTVPAATKAVVIGFLISNKFSNVIYVDIDVASISYGKSLPLPNGSTLSALDGKLVMDASETISITIDTASAADAYISVMEMT